MTTLKKLSIEELDQITGGKKTSGFGTCVIGAYGAAGVGALTGKGAKFGPIGMALSALSAEIVYMGENRCFG